MSIWSGWQDQLLTVAILPRNASTRQFMTDWHNHANTDCDNNPVDISLNISGASPCKLTSNPNNRARNYANHDQAAGQFAAQIHENAYAGLLAAIKTGDPYTAHAANLMGDDLLNWGSDQFAAFYSDQVNKSIGGGGIQAPKAHNGWRSMRVSFNQKMPAGLHASKRSTDAALRTLRKARKVRI